MATQSTFTFTHTASPHRETTSLCLPCASAYVFAFFGREQCKVPLTQFTVCVRVAGRLIYPSQSKATESEYTSPDYVYHAHIHATCKIWKCNTRREHIVRGDKLSEKYFVIFAIISLLDAHGWNQKKEERNARARARKREKCCRTSRKIVCFFLLLAVCLHRAARTLDWARHLIYACGARRAQ